MYGNHKAYLAGLTLYDAENTILLQAGFNDIYTYGKEFVLTTKERLCGI